MNDVLPDYWDDLKTIPIFVTHVRTSERLRAALAVAQGDKKLELVAEVCTRWGSRYDMLHRFLQLKEAVLAVAVSVDRNKASDDVKVKLFLEYSFFDCELGSCLFFFLLFFLSLADIFGEGRRRRFLASRGIDGKSIGPCQAGD